VDKSPEEPWVGRAPYPERCNAALERAFQEALLALVALSQQRHAYAVATAEAPVDAAAEGIA